MGLSIKASGLPDSLNITMGYGQFKRFRERVVSVFDELQPLDRSDVLSEYLAITMNSIPYIETPRGQKIWETLKNEHPGLYLFLFHSDCDGKFSSKECRMIYDELSVLELWSPSWNELVSVGRYCNGTLEHKTVNLLDTWKQIFLYCAKRRVNLYFC